MLPLHHERIRGGWRESNPLSLLHREVYYACAPLYHSHSREVGNCISTIALSLPHLYPVQLSVAVGAHNHALLYLFFYRL